MPSDPVTVAIIIAGLVLIGFACLILFGWAYNKAIVEDRSAPHHEDI